VSVKVAQNKWPFCNTSRVQIHQLPHNFAAKGVLNVLGRVLPK